MTELYSNRLERMIRMIRWYARPSIDSTRTYAAYLLYSQADYRLDDKKTTQVSERKGRWRLLAH
jgi:hypothetical protein